MKLSDMVSRDSTVEWFEAVAVVRDLIDRLDGSDPSRAPELHQVQLLSIGEVELLGSVATDAQVDHVMRILRLLLTQANSPKELAALLDQQCPTLEALSSALEHFERPNRQVVLQHLYLRMTDSVPVPQADELIASLRAAVITQAPEQTEKEVRRGIDRRSLYFGAAAVGALVLASIAMGLLWRGGYTGASIVGAVSSIGQRMGLGTGQPAPPPALEAVEATTATAGKAPFLRVAPSVSKAVSRTVTLASLTATAVPPVPRRPSYALDLFAPPSPAAVVERVVPASQPDMGIYAAGSTDVEPPVGIRPHVPKELPPSFSASDVATVEILIGLDGTVESAKLVGGSRFMHDAMMVSAAKAWRFRPAMKNGVPVRYRTTLLVPW